jgi:hypothetical protein
MRLVWVTIIWWFTSLAWGFTSNDESTREGNLLGGLKSCPLAGAVPRKNMNTRQTSGIWPMRGRQLPGVRIGGGFNLEIFALPAHFNVDLLHLPTWQDILGG